jgi:hypothetical protein
MSPASQALNLHRASNPQLALWATDMSSALPTEALPHGRATAPIYFSIFFRILSA